MINVAINGAAGRMGKRLIALGAADPAISLVCAAEMAASEEIGKDAGIQSGVAELGLPIASELGNSPQVVIDFSTPEGAEAAIEYCGDKQIALVMASTGLEQATIDKLNQVATKTPVCWAPNMSLAVNLTMKLVETAATALANHSSGVDVEIIETHHRYKADSPSGTALKFGEIVAGKMGQANHQHGREGVVGQRPQGEIGYHAVRAGDDTGQHTILFGMLGEKIEVKVASSNRDCYALGAFEAAKYLVNQPPGMYSMQDVLGIQ